MRVAALYDIHGNLPALESVLAGVRQARADYIIVGGDVVPGPMPHETLATLLDLDIPTRFIHGNGDREVLARMTGTETNWYRKAPEPWREPVRWTAEQLSSGDYRVMASWPATCFIEIPGLGDVLFCHGTPRSDTGCFTQLTPEDRLVPLFEGLDVSLVVCGHTHMQFDRLIGGVRVVNAGSVGMPFGEPGAYWLLLDPEVQLRRTPYDLAEAAEQIRRTEYPQAEDFVTHAILRPPSEETALAMYSRQDQEQRP